MISISSRLLDIINHINKDDLIIDIGCDHAYLAIYLVECFNYKKIYVSDNKKLALENGIKNIKKNKLTKTIFPLLGNGLSVLNDEKVNTVIVSGLGAYTILEIINDSNLKQINKLVIQANQDYYFIRKNITKLGFIISNETVVFEKKHYYITISFIRGQKKYKNSQLKYGFHNDINYYKYLIANEYKIIKNLKIKNTLIIIKHIANIISIKKYLFFNKIA